MREGQSQGSTQGVLFPGSGSDTGVSGALTIWRHIYKAFTCLTKAQTELRPKTPLFTCSFFVFVFFFSPPTIPFKRPSHRSKRGPNSQSLFMHHNSESYIGAVAKLLQHTWQTKTKTLLVTQLNTTLNHLSTAPCNKCSACGPTHAAILSNLLLI